MKRKQERLGDWKTEIFQLEPRTANSRKEARGKSPWEALEETHPMEEERDRFTLGSLGGILNSMTLRK